MNIPQTISTKQLRENFPQIRDLLETGKSFLLIHRSRPIAQIKPIDTKSGQQTLSKQIDKVSGGLKLGSYLTPSKIDSLLDQRYG